MSKIELIECNEEIYVSINGYKYSTFSIAGKRDKYFNSKFAVEGDVNYDEVKTFRGYDFPNNTFISIDFSGNNKNYLNLQFIDFSRINEKLNMSLEVGFHPSGWDENINILSFVEILRSQLFEKYNIYSSQENIFEEDLISIKFLVKHDINKKIKKNIKSFVGKIRKEQRDIIDHYESYGKIITKTFIPNTHKGTAISLMHYFNEFSKSKEPDIDLSINILDKNNIITMELEFPNKFRDKVDLLAKDYSLILSGRKKPSDVLTNHNDILLLNCELKNAQTRIEIQKDIISSSSEQINSLKEDVAWLKEQVSLSFSSRDKYLDSLLELLTKKREKTTVLSQQLAEGIVNNDEELIKSTTARLKESEPENFKMIKNFISNIISSAGANAPAWIDFLSKVFV